MQSASEFPFAVLTMPEKFMIFSVLAFETMLAALRDHCKAIEGEDCRSIVLAEGERVAMLSMHPN
jgi:hypothetical protein